MAKYETPQAIENHEDLHATQARQGSWGRDVLVVLLASTALAVLVLFATLLLAPDMSGQGPGVRQTAPYAAGVENAEGQPTGF